MRSHALVAVLLALSGGAARADAIRLAVVPLDAPPELTFIGKSLSEAIAAEARRAPGFAVVGPEEVEARLGRDGTAALVRCADDARCLSERAARLGVDRVVAGWVQKAGEAYRVALVHVDVRAGARVAALEREIPIASRRLKQDVVAAAPRLLAGEGDPTGVLVVETDVAGASVTIDGRSAGTTPLTRALKPGKHAVQVSRAGYAAADPVWVEVAAAATVTHRPRLYEIPARDRGNGPSAGETKVDAVR